MKNTSTYVVTSGLKYSPAEAAVDAIRKSISLYKEDTQLLHMVIANIIRKDKKWKAVISVFREPDVDDIPDPAITFAHLPRKYEELYDALSPEVDNLNLIEDDSVWTNLKSYLLDIYFYQAVNFKEIERIADMKRGFFEEKESTSHLVDLEVELTLDPRDTAEQQMPDSDKIFDVSFYKAAATQTLEREQQVADAKVRKMSDPKTKAILKQLGLFNAY